MFTKFKRWGDYLFRTLKRETSLPGLYFLGNGPLYVVHVAYGDGRKWNCRQLSSDRGERNDDRVVNPFAVQVGDENETSDGSHDK